MSQDIERAREKETAEQMFVYDQLSHLTDLLKVGLVDACAVLDCINRPLQIDPLSMSSVSKRVWSSVCDGHAEVQRFAEFLQCVVRKRRAHTQYGGDQIRHLAL